MIKKKIVLMFGMFIILILLFQLTYAARLSVECKDTVYTYGLASDIMRHVEQTCMEDFRVFHDAKGKCLDEYGFQKRVNELSVDDENCKTSGENCITGAYSDYRSCDDICYNNYYGKITSADSNEQREYWGNVYNGCVSDCRDDLGDSKKSCCTCYYEYRKKYYKTYRELFDCTAYLLDCFVDFSEFDVEDEYEEEEEEQYEEISCEEQSGIQTTDAVVFDSLDKSSSMAGVTGYAGFIEMAGGSKPQYGYTKTDNSIVQGAKNALKTVAGTLIVCGYIVLHPRRAVRRGLMDDINFAGEFEQRFGRKLTEKEYETLYTRFNYKDIQEMYWGMSKDDPDFTKFEQFFKSELTKTDFARLKVLTRQRRVERDNK